MRYMLIMRDSEEAVEASKELDFEEIIAAMGRYNAADGDHSTAMGYYTTASGDSATAMGVRTTASGESSTAMRSAEVPRVPCAVTSPGTMSSVTKGSHKGHEGLARKKPLVAS